MNQTSVKNAADSERARRPYWAIALSVFAVSLVGYYAFRERPAKPPELLTVTRGEAVYRAESNGRIVPREEVFVRSQVSGQLVEMNVKAGDAVRKGEQIALIRVIADPVQLGEARAQVRVAEAKLMAAKRELSRLDMLQDGMGLSSQEAAKTADLARIAETELAGARERLRLIAEGVASSQGGRSTRVIATIDGTVLATPVAVGDFVGDMNAYRDGSTIAVLADMTRLVFKGQIEESHVGKLRLGMPATVNVGALPGLSASGKLTWVAPRATVEQGATSAGSPAQSSSGSGAAVAPLTASTAGITRFELWVELDRAPPDMRAGYTASAELVLDRRENVPVIEERALRFEKGKVFARVYGADGRTEEREITVGVSDGITIELVSGIAVGEKVAIAPSEKTAPN
ncbi:MAG: efflux RND transporter periplasmic adaptor subunit [Polyangiales bacterium]